MSEPAVDPGGCLQALADTRRCGQSAPGSSMTRCGKKHGRRRSGTAQRPRGESGCGSLRRHPQSFPVGSLLGCDTSTRHREPLPTHAPSRVAALAFEGGAGALRGFAGAGVRIGIVDMLAASILQGRPSSSERSRPSAFRTPGSRARCMRGRRFTGVAPRSDAARAALRRNRRTE